jgi:hypothetical protein
MDTAGIDEILGNINWDIVRSYYSATKKLKDLELDRLLIWEKTILRRRMHFLIKSNQDKLICTNWIIRCTYKTVNKESSPVKLHVQFTPISESISLVEDDLPMKSRGRNPEWESLYKLMYHYSDTEEYELCQIIKNRLNEIVEEMRVIGEITL